MIEMKGFDFMQKSKQYCLVWNKRVHWNSTLITYVE